MPDTGEEDKERSGGDSERPTGGGGLERPFAGKNVDQLIAFEHPAGVPGEQMVHGVLQQRVAIVRPDVGQAGGGDADAPRLLPVALREIGRIVRPQHGCQIT